MSMSCVIVGAAALASVLAGYLQGADIAPILITTGGGLAATSIWWAISGNYVEAWAFGTFAGFNLTYASLQIGITNGWYGIPVQDLANVVSVYVAAWLFLFTILAIVVSHELMQLAAAMMVVNCTLSIILTANLMNSIEVLRWAAIPMVALIVLSAVDILQVLRGWQKRNRAAVLNLNAAQNATTPLIAIRGVMGGAPTTGRFRTLKYQSDVPTQGPDRDAMSDRRRAGCNFDQRRPCRRTVFFLLISCTYNVFSGLGVEPASAACGPIGRSHPLAMPLTPRTLES